MKSVTILIKDGNVVIATIIRNSTWPEGLHFYSKDTDFLQVSTWNYDSDKHLKAHAHKIWKRETNRTNELIFIKKGKIKAYFYSEKDLLLEEHILRKGDIVIIHAGGHAYDILEDKTQVLEVKNGPYPGLDKDKKIIEQ